MLLLVAIAAALLFAVIVTILASRPTSRAEWRELAVDLSVSVGVTLAALAIVLVLAAASVGDLPGAARCAPWSCSRG